MMRVVWTGALSQWRINPSSTICGLFSLICPQKFFEGSHDVVCFHRGPPGHQVGVYQPLAIVEGQHHLLYPRGLGLALYCARIPLFNQLLGLLLGLRCVVCHGRLVHGDNLVEEGVWLPLIAGEFMSSETFKKSWFGVAATLIEDDFTTAFQKW